MDDASKPAVIGRSRASPDASGSFRPPLPIRLLMAEGYSCLVLAFFVWPTVMLALALLCALAVALRGWRHGGWNGTAAGFILMIAVVATTALSSSLRDNATAAFHIVQGSVSGL